MVNADLDRARSRPSRLPAWKRIVIGSSAAAAAAVLGVISAGAVTGPVGQSLNVSPTTVTAGRSVTVSGVAPNCKAVTLLSNAFPSTQSFAGVNAVTATSGPSGAFTATVTIPASRAAGSYSISARACGGNLGLTVDFRVTRPIAIPPTGSDLEATTVTGGGLLVAGALLVLLGRRRRRVD